MPRAKKTNDLLLPDTGEILERALFASGVSCFCGVDEAGRGPLAGPVVAAAVLYRDCPALWNACDSKRLSRAAREERFLHIVKDMEFAVGICDCEEIDRLNILQATLQAMRHAVKKLRPKPGLILVDGKQNLGAGFPSRAIVHGDARVALIGAASIVAKVTRDRIMIAYDHLYPAYGFARHFGYPTAAHRLRIRQIGPCPIHRRTFRGVREFLQEAVSD
ncbi:MAG: ribonuclease HII [bacterium]|nr:ribonuclease HII [bacterium]